MREAMIISTTHRTASAPYGMHAPTYEDIKATEEYNRLAAEAERELLEFEKAQNANSIANNGYAGGDEMQSKEYLMAIENRKKIVAIAGITAVVVVALALRKRK